MPPSHEADDVVVVGVRCAGATAARLLAERGLDVLLVDRTRSPVDTVSTHESLLGATIQLRRWGLLETIAATGATKRLASFELKLDDVSPSCRRCATRASARRISWRARTIRRTSPARRCRRRPTG